MTLKEADEAAMKCLPVILTNLSMQGKAEIEYIRISQTGYSYDEKGKRHPFVQLIDKCGHSVSYADPADVKLKEATE